MVDFIYIIVILSIVLYNIMNFLDKVKMNTKNNLIRKRKLKELKNINLNKINSLNEKLSILYKINSLESNNYNILYASFLNLKTICDIYYDVKPYLDGFIVLDDLFINQIVYNNQKQYIKTRDGLLIRFNYDLNIEENKNYSLLIDYDDEPYVVGLVY